jgi:hypothetical protein
MTEPVSAGQDTDIREVWKKVLETVDAPLASKLEHADIELNGDELKVILNGGHAVFQETIAKNLKAIEKVLGEHTGRKIRIATATRHRKVVPKKDLKKKALDEPAVKEALELFEGRIVDVIPVEEEGNNRNGGDDV